jgi:hypothetical protein
VSDVVLQIKIDSAPAQSGSAAIRAELDAIKAKFADVLGAASGVGDGIAKGLNEASAASTKAATAFDTVTKASKSHKDAAGAQKQTLAELKALIDTSAPAMNHLTAETLRGADVFIKHSHAGAQCATSVKSLTDALSVGAAASVKAADGIQTANGAALQAGTGVKNLSFVVGQAGYQIADLAIVSQMGGQAIGQMGIQVGQFLGVLGPTGAVAGAAVTILGVLAGSYLNSGNEAETAAEKQKAYTKALDAAIPTINRYYEAKARAEGRNPNERGEGQAADDVRTQIAELERQREDMVRRKSFFQAPSLSLMPDATDFSKIDTDLAKLRNTLFQIQSTPKETGALDIKRTISETAEAREKELAIVRLATTGKEREAAMLKAEQDVREKLKSVFADDSAVSAQVAAARTQAATVYDLKKAQEDREQAARDSETARKKRAKDEQDELHESLRLLQMKVTAERAGSSGKVDAAANASQFARDKFGPASSEFKTADSTLIQADREYRREQQQLAQEAANSQIALSRVTLQAEREGLDQQVTLGQISAAEKIAILRDLTNQEAALELESVATAQASVEEGTVQWEQAQNKKLLIAANTNRQMAALDRQATTDRMAQVKEWTSPFTAGVNSMVQGFGQGTLTMSQMARRSAAVIATSYMGKMADVATTAFQKHVVMAAWDKAFATREVATAATKETAKKGIVAASEAQKTGATAAGVTTRAAIGAGENTSFFGRVGEQLAEWLGLETAKTAETVTGATARTSAEATAAMTAAVTAKAEAATEIPAYAGIGAAAAMASVAAIPFIGWAMAPAVGAEHAALAMGYLGLASAEGGWEHVPEDGMITELHKDEKVLSAPFSRRLDKLMNNVDSMQATGAGVALSGVGMAGAGMSIPAGLQRPANNNMQTTNNSTSSSTAPVFHISPVFHSKGKLTKEEVMEHSATIAKAVEKEARQFSPSSRRRV